MTRTIVRRKGVMGGRPCLSGTRIPTEAIITLFMRGFSIVQIVVMYAPHLNEADVDAALRYELNNGR